MNMYIIRHGESDKNLLNLIQGQSNSNLTSQGIVQMELTKKALNNIIFSAIYSSDQHHAYQSTRILKNINVNTPIIMTKMLRERNLGKLEGLKKDILNIEIEGVESIENLMIRANTFIKMITSKYKDETILIVAHGAIICAIVSTLMKVSFDTKYKMKDICNSSITIFEPVPHMMTFSSISHLEN